MKIAACFLYVFFSIIYLAFTDGGIYWGGFNIITQIAFVGFVCYLEESNKKHSEKERLFFSYIKWLSVTNSGYIIVCMIKGKFFSIYNTDVFAYIMGISLIIMFTDFALKKQ